MFALWRLKMLRKLLDDFLCWIGYYPPTVVAARKKILESNKIYKAAIKKAKPAVKRKPAAKTATTRSKTMATKPGLYANIHAKQARIEKQKADGKPVETMRKPGTKGAPTAKAFKEAAKTVKAKK
jgi:hypothetical protein